MGQGPVLEVLEGGGLAWGGRGRGKGGGTGAEEAPEEVIPERLAMVEVGLSEEEASCGVRGAWDGRGTWR